MQSLVVWPYPSDWLEHVSPTLALLHPKIDIAISILIFAAPIVDDCALILESRVRRFAKFDLLCHVLDASSPSFILSDAVINIVVLKVSVIDVHSILLLLPFQSEWVIAHHVPTPSWPLFIELLWTFETCLMLFCSGFIVPLEINHVWIDFKLWRCEVKLIALFSIVILFGANSSSAERAPLFHGCY